MLNFTARQYKEKHPNEQRLALTPMPPAVPWLATVKQTGLIANVDRSGG